MRPLSTLIHEADADDPLARALEAILDSGLIVFSRDPEGRFVQLSKLLSDRAGIIADRGSSQPRNMRVFDEHGRLLSGSEYPAAVVRMTGSPQRELVRRLVSEDGREIWLRMSVLPLERSPEGWSTLTLGTDVTDLCETIEAGKREIAARGALLKLSQTLDEQPLSGAELVDAFREPLHALVPGANVAVAIRQGEEYATTPVMHGFGEPMTVRRGRYANEQRDRWTADHAHVNRDVQDTDIYGSNVVAEFPNPMRSLVIAPCFSAGNQRVAALVAYYGRPGAFTDDQIASLEFTARLFGRALEAAEPLARAS